jgi:GH15 family glucan-1,4-alpha-glucosidase
MPLRIEDYALIGDCESAALVGSDGSIDWFCAPRFDSPAAFAALLGTPEHGRWLVAPAVDLRQVRRQYREGTLILETEFDTAAGCVRLLDFMPPRTETPEIVRIVEGVRGTVPMRTELTIRFDYGSIVPWVRRIKNREILSAIAGPDALYLKTAVELRGENFHTVGEFTVAAGQRVPFRMAWAPSQLDPPEIADATVALDDTERWWTDWSARCTYDGEYHDLVSRSLITLKALAYAPTGGLVAAVTTSLPEKIGGVRNWDYRFCWLRDATFTLYALMVGGYMEEAQAWREWLLRAVAGNPAQASIMYGVAGERRLNELTLDWLPGYEGSRPVRQGNAAHAQFQLDVYGEVMDSLYCGQRGGLEPNPDAWALQQALLEFLETAWQEPDEGLWEVRGPRRHFTHSKVMAWVALDRAVKSVEKFGMEGPLERWRDLRARIHAEVCAKGYDPELKTFVQFYGGKTLDASLLMIPLVGFLPANDPRMLGTVAAIQKGLVHDGFVSRYTPMPDIDGLPPGEAPFLACTFWLADNLALQGRLDEAREVFERVAGVRNDVGLLSEEYDPAAKRLLGNFPQAFSHVGLINTARNLTQSGGPAEHRQHK